MTRRRWGYLTPEEERALNGLGVVPVHEARPLPVPWWALPILPASAMLALFSGKNVSMGDDVAEDGAER